jgi:hypothetical protein
MEKERNLQTYEVDENDVNIALESNHFEIAEYLKNKIDS